jgi:hypothetical protein
MLLDKPQRTMVTLAARGPSSWPNSESIVSKTPSKSLRTFSRCAHGDRAFKVQRAGEIDHWQQ